MIINQAHSVSLEGEEGKMVGVFMGPRVKDYRAKASGIRFPEPLNRSVPVRTPSKKMRMGRDKDIAG